MNFKKVVALSICAAMVAGMSMSTVMAADLPDQFKDLNAPAAPVAKFLCEVRTVCCKVHRKSSFSCLFSQFS